MQKGSAETPPFLTNEALEVRHGYPRYIRITKESQSCKSLRK